jgi:hypothetical protein
MGVVSAIAGTHWSTQSSPFLLSYSSPHQSTDRVPRGSRKTAAAAAAKEPRGVEQGVVVLLYADSDQSHYEGGSN